MKHLLRLVLLLGALIVSAADPIISIPKIATPPKIDGKMTPGEWDSASAFSMFGSFSNGKSLVLQQPTFYYAWDDTYLYIGLDSRESSANAITANTTRNDFLGIAGDDNVELMFAGAVGKEAFDADFPTYYIVLNYLGTVWDCKFKPQRNEEHNSWQSGIEFESSVNGTRWVMEARLPLKNISLKAIVPNVTQWRMNMSRTHYNYQYAVLNPGGALNDCRIGSDATFRDNKAIVRLKSAGNLARAILSVPLELVNNSDKDATFEVTLDAVSRNDVKSEPVELKSTKKVTVPAGKTLEVVAGNGAKLSWLNTVELTVKDEAGNVLLYIPRNVPIPVHSLSHPLAKDIPPVDINSVFLPSKDTLTVKFDARFWLKKVSLPDGKFSAKIKVLDANKKVIKEDNVKFGVATEWTCSTKDLPEGSYFVEVEAYLGDKKINEVSDWFEKKIFSWMKEPVVGPDYLPAPYTAVKTDNDTASIWGRSYKFGTNGLPVSLITQGKDYLTAPVQLLLNGKELKKSDGFRFTKTKAVEADGESNLIADGVRIKVESATEYDGFTLFKVTCSPEKESAKLDSLQIKVPLNSKLIKFHSASGNNQGTSFMGKPVPQGDGKIYDSFNDSRAVGTTPTFACLYWVADNDVCFCYAADSDKGWAIRKDVPAIEAWRKGDTVELTIKLVDRPVTLDGPRTMEFAFQTGPTKPLPENWRSFEDYTNTWAPALPKDIPNVRKQIGGDGFTLHGGTHNIHPGNTPEMIQKSKEKIDKLSAEMNGRVHVVGYQYWGQTVKGYPEMRVFRGEWGHTAESYTNGGSFDAHKWGLKTYGPDKNYYYYIGAKTCPSYINFLAWAYDRALTETNLYGFYDDVGYPFTNYYPEFGQGWTDEDGEQHFSSGLWLYRKRWKLINKVNAKHNRLNLTSDSQHIHAHYMPAYAFIGVYAPCERGFYNPFPEKDAYEFFGSLDHYAAMCPAKQFGQMAMIGLASYRPLFQGFSQDSRTMFMLTAMHDQTLGTFGRRDYFTIDSMIEARGLFRAWEPGTEFTGYWQSEDAVKGSSPDLKTSYYTRNGAALFLMTNIGDKEAEFTVTPSLKKMGLDASKVKFTNAETLEQLPFDGSFKVRIAKHDLCMVLCGADGSFQFPAVMPWKTFVGDKGLVTDFKGVFPDRGIQSFGKYKDMMFVQGASGGYAYVETTQKLPECFTMSAISCGSIFGIRWANDSYLEINANAARDPKQDKASAFYNGKWKDVKMTLNHEPQYGYTPKSFNAVQVKVLKDKIEFYVSADAKTWQLIRSEARTEKYAGAPEAIYVGWGGNMKGPNKFHRNVQNHFSPNSTHQVFFSLFGNLCVTEEK